MTKREMGPLHTGTTPREQRLAAAGRVAAGLLHEFRNVLGPIANIAFLLERQADDATKVRELARRLAAQATVQGRVAERLRDFITQDAARFEESSRVDLVTLVREVAGALQPLAAAQVGVTPTTIELDLPATVEVPGDPTALRTAILELGLAALDSSSGTGGPIHISVTSDATRASVHILDGGKFDRAVAEFVFDPFISSVHDPDAGLGLSAAWGIVRRHGGELSYGPGPDDTTLATLKIPLSQGET